MLTLTPSLVAAQSGLSAEETELVLRDSQNAHEVAKLALDGVACILGALEEGADWTVQDCLRGLKEAIAPLGQEHMLLHPKVKALLQAKKNTVRS